MAAMSRRAYLFDWGNTLMRDLPDEAGAMCRWSRVEAMPHAAEVLEQLSGSARCFLATNAADSTRQDIVTALGRVGLDRYLSGIFCARELGCAKPSREYFDAVLTALAELGIDRSQTLMIGDSLETDVLGAQACGIGALLYDPEARHPGYPGPRITDLRRLLDSRP
jgi:putative hydrolase of the HAD superfamily